MDVRREIDVFYNNLENDFNNFVIGKEKIEEKSLESLKEYIEYYEDIQKIMISKVKELIQNVGKYDLDVYQEYMRRCISVFEKADLYISEINQVLNIKKSLILDKVHKYNSSKSPSIGKEIIILNNGGKYDNLDKEYKDEKFKVMNPEKIIGIKKTNNEEEINDIIDLVKSGFKGSVFVNEIPNKVKNKSNNKKKENNKENKNSENKVKQDEKNKLENNKENKNSENKVKQDEKNKLENNSNKKNKQDTIQKQVKKENPSKKEETKKEVFNVVDGKKVINYPVSLRDLYDNKIIPNNVKKEDLLRICNSLGISANDLNYELNQEQYFRIMNDKEINDAKFNLDLVSKHKSIIDEYDRLINEYEELYSQKVKSGTIDSNSIISIKKTINYLIQEKNKYEDKINKMDYKDVSSYYQFNIGFENKATFLDQINNKVNDKIRENYKVLDNERIELKNAKSNKMKKIISKRIEKTEKTIKSLKEKEAFYNSRQIKIVNNNSNKYINIVKYRQKKYINEKNLTVNNIVSADEIHNDSIILESEKDRIERDIANIQGKSIKDRIDKSKLRKEQKHIDDILKYLKKKEGYCNKQIQHYQKKTIYTVSF